MNVHEYQAKQLFRDFGVAVPEGGLAETPAEAEAVAKRLGTGVVVVKAQIHAGGRGKGGGVKLAKSPGEAKQHASEILGMQLVTHQTGPEGKLVRKVYVEAGSDIARELYLAITLDRATEDFAIIASTEGGMDIEEVAAKTPDKIQTVFVHPNVGLRPWQARQIGFGLGLDKDQVAKFEAFLGALWSLYVEKDCSLVEINPLVVTKQGDLFALAPEQVRAAWCSGGCPVRVWDRASMIALPPDRRGAYVDQIRRLAGPGGRVLLDTLIYDQALMSGPPFSVDEGEVRARYPDAEVEVIDFRPIPIDPRWAQAGVDRLYQSVFLVQL